MPYVSLRMEHISVGEATGRIAHNERIPTKKKEDGTMGLYLGKHENINAKKKHLNQDLDGKSWVEKQESGKRLYARTYLTSVRHDLEKHKEANPDCKHRNLRANANMACEFVIQAGKDNEIPPEDQKDFLKFFYKKFKKSFKGQEVLQAKMHLDEKEPHLHIVMSHFNRDLMKWNQIGNFSKGKTFAFYQDWIGEVGKEFSKNKDYELLRGEEKEVIRDGKGKKIFYNDHAKILSKDQIKQVKTELYNDPSLRKQAADEIIELQKTKPEVQEWARERILAEEKQKNLTLRELGDELDQTNHAVKAAKGLRAELSESINDLERQFKIIKGDYVKDLLAEIEDEAPSINEMNNVLDDIREESDMIKAEKVIKEEKQGRFQGKKESAYIPFDFLTQFLQKNLEKFNRVVGYTKALLKQNSRLKKTLNTLIKDDQFKVLLSKRIAREKEQERKEKVIKKPRQAIDRPDDLPGFGRGR
jgi:hypothetical protein